MSRESQSRPRKRSEKCTAAVLPTPCKCERCAGIKRMFDYLDRRQQMQRYGRVLKND